MLSKPGIKHEIFELLERHSSNRAISEQLHEMDIFYTKHQFFILFSMQLTQKMRENHGKTTRINSNNYFSIILIIKTIIMMIIMVEE